MSVAGLIAHNSSIGAADSSKRADGITMGVIRGTSIREYEVAFISVSIRRASLSFSALYDGGHDVYAHLTLLKTAFVTLPSSHTDGLLDGLWGQLDNGESMEVTMYRLRRCHAVCIEVECSQIQCGVMVRVPMCVNFCTLIAVVTHLP